MPRPYRGWFVGPGFTPAFSEAAAAIAHAGDAHARAPERFPGAEDDAVGLQKLRRTDPTLTLST